MRTRGGWRTVATEHTYGFFCRSCAEPVWDEGTGLKQRHCPNCGACSWLLNDFHPLNPIPKDQEDVVLFILLKLIDKRREREHGNRHT